VAARANVTYFSDGRAGRRPSPGSLQVVAYLGLAVLVTNLALPLAVSGGLNLYVAQPAIWLGLGALCVRLQGRAAPLPARGLLVLSVLAGLVEIGGSAAAGLVYGFGYSTYARGPLPIAENLFYLGSFLFGVESARAYLVGRWQGRGWPAFLGIAVLFAAVAVPLARWEMFAASADARFAVSGRYFLPAVADSFLATALAAAGGPWASIAYRGVVLAAEWLSPFLPQLTWTEAALVGVLGPGAALLGLRSALAGEPAETDRAEKRRVPAWLVTFSAIIVAAIWLNTGLLGVRPALVSGVSMEPNLVLGDIVVTRSVPVETLKAGDIVRYQSGAVPVLHRIIEVRRGPDGQRVFITQGDNNNFGDAPVPASAVSGKVILTIPKLGRIPIAVKSWLSR
jgi:signal peptidase I